MAERPGVMYTSCRKENVGARFCGAGSTYRVSPFPMSIPVRWRQIHSQGCCKKSLTGTSVQKTSSIPTQTRLLWALEIYLETYSNFTSLSAVGKSPQGCPPWTSAPTRMEVKSRKQDRKEPRAQPNTVLSDVGFSSRKQATCGKYH